MTRQRTGAWIDVYPLKNLSPRVIPSASKSQLGPKLSKHAKKLWTPKAEKGWANSWVPFVSNLSIDDSSIMDPMGGGLPHAKFTVGPMQYSEVEGVSNAIGNDLPFAPQQGFNNCLSVGLITATEDGKVIFQRRPDNVHCPSVLVSEPTGYMTSLAFSKMADCGSPEHAQDQRLFSLEEQLAYRANELTEKFGLEPQALEYRPLTQDFLGAGWQTGEMYFSKTAKLRAKETELVKNPPEGQEFFFIPLEHLKDLINNQGRLSKMSAATYRPSDPREIPLLDEAISGLIWGYEGLTGESLDIQGTVDRLNSEGLNIKVHDTSPGAEYDFSVAV